MRELVLKITLASCWCHRGVFKGEASFQHEWAAMEPYFYLPRQKVSIFFPHPGTQRKKVRWFTKGLVRQHVIQNRTPNWGIKKEYLCFKNTTLNTTDISFTKYFPEILFIGFTYLLHSLILNQDSRKGMLVLLKHHQHHRRKDHLCLRILAPQCSFFPFLFHQPGTS